MYHPNIKDAKKKYESQLAESSKFDDDLSKLLKRKK